MRLGFVFERSCNSSANADVAILVADSSSGMSGTTLCGLFRDSGAGKCSGEWGMEEGKEITIVEDLGMAQATSPFHRLPDALLSRGFAVPALGVSRFP